MNRPVNICTSTLAAFSLDDALRLGAAAGYEGVELRVHGNCHVSLQELQRRCIEIKRQVEAHRLELCVYSTCFGVNEPGSLDAMIDICARTGVRHFRVALPLAGVAAVRNFATDRAVVPSYREDADLAWRAQLLGWDAIYVPEATAAHVRRVTPERRSALPPAINRYSVRNRFLLRLKNQTAGQAVRFAAAGLARDLQVVGYVLAREWSSIPGLVDVARLLPRTLAKRRAIMARRDRQRSLDGWFT